VPNTLTGFGQADRPIDAQRITTGIRLCLKVRIAALAEQDNGYALAVVIAL
jgi:hypothetical protein